MTSREKRKEFGNELRRRWPWLPGTAVGPGAVEAGECDRCHREARLVNVCGPGAWQALGRCCALELGVSAWCDGHAAEGLQHLEQLREMPVAVDAVARAWWVATGEVHLPIENAADALPAMTEDHAGHA